MKLRYTIFVLALIPVLVAGAFSAMHWPMNAAVIAVLGGVMIWLAYTRYARRIDRDVLQPDPKKATPARMYMDGVDFMPTSRHVLYGYHFKSIAAAGPIVGVITATNLWGWMPSLLWLILGVTFIGWVSDYSAIMLAVRNEGQSLSAIAHRLIAPRTRIILFVFIFFYLLLIAGAFIGILAGILDPRADVPFGIFMLAIMGLLMGQALYRWKMDLIGVTVVAILVTLGSMAIGAKGLRPTAGNHAGRQTGDHDRFRRRHQPRRGAESAMASTDHRQKPLYTVTDPTRSDPRLAATTLTPEGKVVPKYLDSSGAIKMMPSFILWCVFLFVFSYLGTILPIWRFAQPVNYIGFWVTFLTIIFSALGAVVGAVRGLLGSPEMMKAVTFQSQVFASWMPMTQAKDAAGNILQAMPAIQPLWPMLFVTIACGAISGWHALFGSIGTARQLEYETDALPVGGGAMFSENTLGLLSLVAVSIVGGAGAGAFASGVGKLLGIVTFGAMPDGLRHGPGFRRLRGDRAHGNATRLPHDARNPERMGGEVWVGFKNAHVAAIVSMLLTLVLVLSGTWIYLWQMFGASNQLMAALGSADRDPVVALHRPQSGICALSHDLHVRDHHGRNPGHRLQPVRQYSVEPEDCVAADQQHRSGRDDPGFTVAVHCRSRDRLRRVAGVAQDRRRRAGCATGDGARLGWRATACIRSS